MGRREVGSPALNSLSVCFVNRKIKHGGTVLSTRIGLISDVHATPEPVAEALALFEEQGVERILCAGDIAGYGEQLDATVGLLVEHNCQAILGNHELRYLDRQAGEQDTPVSRWFKTLPRVMQLTIEGRRLYLVHASPPDSNTDGIKLLGLHGHLIAEEQARWTQQLRGFPHDILLVGHTHQVFCERLGDVLVINPGSTLFNHSCAILRLPDIELELFGLSGRQPVKFWNWGLNQVAR